MVSVTPNRSYPYPECDPPEVKDRSDIAFLRDLAEAVNTDADAEDAQIVQFLEKPDSARMSWAGNLAGTGFTVAYFIPYDTVTYDNTTGIANTTLGGIQVLERGIYMAASTVRAVNPGGGNQQSLTVAHSRNQVIGVSFPGRRFEGPAAAINASGEENMTTVDFIGCEIGDIIQTQVRIDPPAGSYAYEARLAVSQLWKLDV
jgi:hypothetical protein